MPNFKVGDRLIVTGGPWFSKGETVTVVEVDQKDSFHTYKCSDGVSKCWVQNENIEPISKFSVGQIYKVGEINDGRTGNIIKITNIEPNARYQFVFKMIRGSQLSDCHFAEGSVFSNSLILLTGKQIGEAIKAFDDRKTGGVKEVKRHANAGGYIKVTNSDFPLRYSDGDVLIVTTDYNDKPGSMWHNKAVGFNDTGYVIRDTHYVVLEGYKPDSEKQPTEEKRKARVGDTIKILPGAIDICHGYKPGDTVFIDGKNENPDANGFIWGCGAALDEYVITFPTGTIHIAGKHVWTPEEIEKAKTIVLDNIREIYEESKGSVVFSRDAGSDKIQDAFFTEKGYSTLGYRPLDDTVIAHKARKGTAKCSPTDEPNVWIGKCVALCKALHKPIPSFIMGD